MGCGSSIPTDKRVVIVGGGYGGVRLAMALRNYNLVLIDPKDSFAHNVANVRAVVQPELVNKMYIDYSLTFGEKFVQGKVISVDPEKHEVVLEDQRKIPYDILVLATGSKTDVAGPSKLWSQNKSEAQEFFNECSEKIKSAKRIGLIGGGAVGVEIAAEICTQYKDKEVYLFHSTDQLIQPGLSAKLQTKLKAILGDRLKCKLVLGGRVENLEELLASGATGPLTVQVAGEPGTSQEVDLVIPCTGVKPNSLAYAQGLGECMEESGAIKVTPYLQVEGHDDIYAIGDCTNVREKKLVMNTQNQADAIINNLKLVAKGAAPKPYVPDQIPVKAVVSLGKSSGLGESAGGSVIPEFMVTQLKSKGLFISKQWGEMKQKMP